MDGFQGILLDVDGTLVDSNDAHASAWEQALIDYGIVASFAAIRCRIGMGGDQLLPEVAGIEAESSQGKLISARRGEIFQNTYLPKLKPFPQAKELLTRMRKQGLRLVVASSSKKDELDALLRLCGANELIQASTCADDVDRSKPDPAIIQVALERLGAQAGQTLLLGDTPYDIAAAKRASVGTLALRCGGWDDEHLADAVAIYDDPAHLLREFDHSPLASK
jgi:HAD superfamily hydrolase (TIGR01509 family)